jgi:hypothetical protein
MTGITKKQKSHTDLSGWTIKGIEIETRVAVQKAAKKEGMTLGKFCNARLREAAHDTLKAKNLPVKPEDLRDEVKLQIDSLKQDLHKIIKDALEESHPKNTGFFKKIFK